MRARSVRCEGCWRGARAHWTGAESGVGQAQRAYALVHLRREHALVHLRREHVLVHLRRERRAPPHSLSLTKLCGVSCTYGGAAGSRVGWLADVEVWGLQGAPSSSSSNAPT
jgi:hypothetical protein